MNTRTLPFYLLVIMFLLSACSPKSAGPATTSLGEKDAGKAIEMKVGDMLVVQLPGNPTTGYTWDMQQQIPAILERVGEAEFKADSNAIGAGGLMTLRFQAIATGEAPLQLIYHRPWETGVAPESTYEVKIVVK